MLPMNASSKSEGRVELNSMMSMYSIYKGTKAPAKNAAGLYGFIAKSTYQQQNKSF